MFLFNNSTYGYSNNNNNNNNNKAKNGAKQKPIPMSYARQESSVYSLLSWRGLLITGQANGSVKVYDAMTAQLIQELYGHEEAVAALCAFEEEFVCSGSFDGTVRVWDLATAEAVAVLTGHRKPVSAVKSTRAGQLLCSGSWDGTVLCWNVRSDRVVFALDQNQGSPVNCLQFFRDESLIVVGCGDGVLRVYSAMNGMKVRELRGAHRDTVRALATFTNDNESLFSAGKDGKVFVWNIDKGTAKNILSNSSSRCSSYDNDNNLTSDNISRDLNNTYVAHDGGCCALQECGGGKLASTGYDGSVKIWDPDSRLFVAQLNAHEGEKVWSLAFDDRMLQLFSAGDKNIFAWDATTAFEQDVSLDGTTEIDVEGRSMSVSSRSVSRADLPRVMSNVSNLSGNSGSLMNLHVHPNMQGSYQNLSNLNSASQSRHGSVQNLSAIVLPADVSGYNSHSSQPSSTTKSRRPKKSDVLRIELESANAQLESYARAYDEQLQRCKDIESANEMLRKHILEQTAALADAENRTNVSKREEEARQSKIFEEKMKQLRQEFEREKALAVNSSSGETSARFDATILEKENMIKKLSDDLNDANLALQNECEATSKKIGALESDRDKNKSEADSLRQLNERLLREYKKTTTDEETQNAEQTRTIALLENEIDSLKRNRSEFEKDSKAEYENILALNKELSAEVSRLSTSIDDANAVIDVLKQDIESAVGQTESVKRDVEIKLKEEENESRLDYESRERAFIENANAEKARLEEKIELLEEALKEKSERLKEEIENVKIDRESETNALKEALGDALKACEIANEEVSHALKAQKYAEMKLSNDLAKWQDREEVLRQDLETKPDTDEFAALKKIDREQKKRIADLGAEFERLNERLREVEEERRRERQNLESAAKDLEKKLEETRENRKLEMKESQNALRDSKERWQKSEGDAQILRSELESVHKRLEEAIKSADTCETSVETRYREEIDRLELSEKTLQRELLDTKNEAENATESSIKAKAQLAEAKEKFAKAVSKGKGFQDQVSMLRETLEEVENRSRDAEREKRNAEAEKERALREIEDAESKEARARDALNHEKKRTSGLKEELREATEKTVKFETLLEEETKKLVEMEAKVKADEFALERERTNAKEIKRESDDLKIRYKVAEKTVEKIILERDEITARLKDTEILLVESEKHVEDAETRVLEAKQSLAFANSRSKELEQKLIEAEQDSPTRLSTADSAREENLNRLDAIEMELGISKRDLAEVREKLAKSLEEVLQLETEAKGRNEELLAAIKEVERLKAVAENNKNSEQQKSKEDKDAEVRRVRWLEQQRLQAAESRAHNLEVELQQLRSEAEKARIAASEAWALASNAGLSRHLNCGDDGAYNNNNNNNNAPPESIIAPSSPGGRSTHFQHHHLTTSRSEYNYPQGGFNNNNNNIASALERQRFEMKIDALKVDVERLRKDRDRARRELERDKEAAKNSVAQVVERLRVEVHARAIAERERDELSANLKRTVRQANDRLDKKTREATRANEDFLEAKRQLEKLRFEKPVEEQTIISPKFVPNEQIIREDVAPAQQAPPRPPPGTKAANMVATTYTMNNGVFVITSEHLKIVLAVFVAIVATLKFLNNNNNNIAGHYGGGGEL